MIPLNRWTITLLLAAVGVFSAHADDAVYKCKGDVFQDHPCAGAIRVAPAPSTAPAQPAYDERALERELDRLQALGVGMIQRTLPAAQPPRVAPVPKTHGLFKPPPRLSRGQRDARDRAITARMQAQTEHNNAVSAAQLGQIIEQQQQQCGGELAKLPTVGMSDETFRQCTMLARFGEVDQIVVGQAGDVALRLYVFPTAKVRRVYAIGGVVTAIKP